MDEPADGLAVARRGCGPRLVVVHGFTQTGRSWTALTDVLAERFEVSAVDVAGHGGSAAVRADLTRGAELVGAAGGRATYVGYSLGGRLCLHLALARPDLVVRLVLVSATAGIDDATERAARRQADEELAEAIEQDGVGPFLERWLAQTMFATLADAGRDDRRRNTAAGLASSLRLAGTGTQAPLWERLSQLKMPVLVVAGALDAAFVARAERMAALIPQATLSIVGGAGHTVHLERPDEFAAALTTWIDASATMP